ncbi:MAG: shikimate dehydrogenase [Rhodospirillales bacterium]
MTISGKARLAGVIGWPVAHSLSPRLHGYWLSTLSVDGMYVPMAVQPGDLAAVLRTLPKMGFRGVNLTVPHKEAALGAVDEVGATARRLGAANTIVVDDDGRLHASNTDGFGFIENLRQSAPGLDLRAAPAVVIGAGGAARAIVAALSDAGCPDIRLVNRTRDRAEALAGDLGGPIEIVDWPARADCLCDAGLLVNTTSLGMIGQPPLDLSLDKLDPGTLVTDIVYAPLETGLLVAARARGNPVVDGLGMLLHQARPGFEAWFGVRPEVTDELRHHVLAGLGRRSP